MTKAMMDGLATKGYYEFENGNIISAYIWTKLVDAKTIYGHRLTAQCPMDKVNDPVLYPGWRGQKDNWEEMGYNSKQEAINDFWGYPSDESNIEAVETSIRKYAKAIVDTLNLYGYDGFDIDYEPVAGPYTGNIVNSDEHLFFFIDELGKYLGPKSGTGRLLVIDGEPQRITTKPEIGTYFDYFIIQAYKPGSDSNLDKRLIDGKVWGPGLVETFGGVMTEEVITRRTIMTENFEATDAAMDGGYPYTDRYGNSMKSLEGMARWQPRNGFRKGGVGTYHMEAEFGTSPEYKNIRRAIQIMNPSSHSLLKN